MNPYCTTKQLSTLYDVRTTAETSTDDGVGGPDDESLQLILDVSASKLDSVLYNRYSLPLLPTPPLVLTEIVAALAMKRLFARRSDLPKGVLDDITRAEKWLEDLVAGRVSVPGFDRQGPTLIATGTRDGSSRFDGDAGLDQSGQCIQSNTARGQRGRLTSFPGG